MLNISQERPVEFPYQENGEIVTIDGKPIILKVAHNASSTYRNAMIEAKRVYGDKPKPEDAAEYTLFIIAEILVGQDNLLDDGIPLDCSDKEKLRKILSTEAGIVKAVTDASKKRPWDLMPSDSTPES